MAAVLAAVLATLAACGPPPPRHPNLLLVVVDTLRRDHLGAYGYRERPTSPALDALAAEALVVEGLIAASPWTQPSVATLFTGLPPARHGVSRLVGRHAVLAEPRTLAAELAAAGYDTGCAMANFLLAARRGAGYERGFAWWDDSVIGPDPHQGSTAARLADLGLQWLEERSPDRPWFLVLHFFDPHLVYEDHPDLQFADPAYAGPIRGGLEVAELRALAGQLDDTDRRQLAALYDEEVRAVDDALGRVFAALRSRPDWSDTLVVVTSDHGEELDERGWIGHTRTLHRELLDVALIVRLPGGARAGERAAAIVAMEGLYATILELAGVAVPPGRGGSFAAFLRGLAPPPSGPAPAEVDFVPALEENDAKRTRLRAAVSADRKLIHDPVRGEWRLYDLRLDPDELDDRAADPLYGADLARLRSWIEAAPWWEGE